MSKQKGIEGAIPSRPVTPDSDPEEESHVPPIQDPEEYAKSYLRSESENVRIGHNGEKVMLANSGGESLLARLSVTERNTARNIHEIAKLRREINEHRMEITENRKEITSLNSRLRQLQDSPDNYLSIRKRFLEVYQRDVKGGEIRDPKAIQQGNIAAHQGDALGDAMLYDRDRRPDRSLYRELYGLDHSQVLENYTRVDDGGLLLVLNAHATMLAKGYIPSAKLR